MSNRTTFPCPDSISVLIPAYNEQDAICSVIRDAAAYLETVFSDWEIVVVESGSTDDTLRPALAEAESEPRIKVHHQERREGMGSALRAGYGLCSKTWICHLEADEPYDLSYIGYAAKLFSEFDMVHGFRCPPPGRRSVWTYNCSTRFGVALRAMYHYGYCLFVWLLFGVFIRDVNFSFKIMRRSLIETLDLQVNGWFVDTELVLEAMKAGARILVVPVVYKGRTEGESTVKPASPFPIIQDALIYRIRRWRRPPTGTAQTMVSHGYHTVQR